MPLDPRAFEDVETDLHAPSHATTAQRRHPRLTWTDEAGPHEVTVDLTLVVGSAKMTDVVVGDSTVSRLHAELDPRPDGLWVRDLGSRNGTVVEGVRVTAGLVPEGGTVRLGAAVMVLASVPVEGSVYLWPNDRF